MDLNHLRYFQKVAQCGSLTKAARELGISQPALTVAVRNLEESLTTTLLVRERTGVSVTSTGQALLKHAADIFALIDRAEQDINGLQQDAVGHFTVGCHEGLGAYFLPDFMLGFLGEAPKVELSVWNGTSRAVWDAVVRREVHFGLVVNPSPHPDLVMLPLFHDAVDVVAHARLVAGVRGDAGAAAELIRTHPLILATRVSQCQELLGQLAAKDVTPLRVLNCGDLELVKSLALAGLGPALLPRRVAAYHHPGKLVRLHPGLPSFPDVISLVYRADLHRTRAAIMVKDRLVVYGRTLDAQADPAVQLPV